MDQTNPWYWRRMPYEERLLRRLDVGDCWEWTGVRNTAGYGRVYHNGRYIPAHRAVWAHLVGEIPAELDIDHLCRNHACCNPDHLEPVTPRVNTRRGFAPTSANARKTHCDQGHEFTPENTYHHKATRKGSRGCRTCARAWAAAYRRRKAER